MQRVRIPLSVSQILLQEGCRARLSGLKQIFENLNAVLEQVQRADKEANELLALRTDEWCAGPAVTASIFALLEKCGRAAQAPDALEKQITRYQPMSIFKTKDPAPEPVVTGIDVLRQTARRVTTRLARSKLSPAESMASASATWKHSLTVAI